METTEQDVDEALKTLKRRTSPGQDKMLTNNQIMAYLKH